jgi:2',3'-cyclic-nucleotide 2'-phosphodiesterase (5'-nucleotidase family)
MKPKHFILIVQLALVSACKQTQFHLFKIEGKQIEISDSLKLDAEIETFITPYKEHIEKDLDSILTYAMDTYSKSDGEFNTAIGNLMADIVFEESNPVFNQRTDKNIDFVLLNYGGIRAIISKGNVRARTAYEIMPFENSIVVVSLKGSKVKSIIDFLISEKKAHPISSQLKIVIDKNDMPLEVTINGKTIEASKIYNIATNDYLYAMGDNMTFFQPNEGVCFLDYKIRNALIDNFKKTDTLNPVIDDRFIQVK